MQLDFLACSCIMTGTYKSCRNLHCSMYTLQVPNRQARARQEGAAPLTEAGNVQAAAKLRIKQNSIVPVNED